MQILDSAILVVHPRTTLVAFTSVKCIHEGCFHSHMPSFIIICRTIMRRLSMHRAEGSFSCFSGFTELLRTRSTDTDGLLPIRLLIEKWKLGLCSELDGHIDGEGKYANLAGKEAIKITEIPSFPPVECIPCKQLAYVCTICVLFYTSTPCWTWSLFRFFFFTLRAIVIMLSTQSYAHSDETSISS